MADNDKLKLNIEKLKNLQRMAGQTVSPFSKAGLAEKAIEAAVEIIEELVDREVKRG